MTLILYFASLVAFLWIAACGYLLYQTRRIGYLTAVEALPEAELPPVAVIVAVRNEEAELASALDSLTQLNYPRYRLLVVNDRSTDRTPQILQSFAERHPQLQLITIRELPDGWLGKNHALYLGYRQAEEEWILFTDADIVFAPDTLRKALSVCRRQRLDHLTLLPAIQSRSALLRGILATFQLMLELRHRPWDTLNPRSTAHLGVGAFNLVRRSAYERAGTHAAFALRPDDDLRLGRRIKQTGGRQLVLYGAGAISLEWYTSVRGFIQGLMKNTFSVYRYRLLPLLILGVLPTFLVFVLPVPALLLSGNGNAQLLAAGVLGAQTALLLLRRGANACWWYGLLMPLAGLLMVYIMLRSAYTTLRQGGIYWRESFYPLTLLRRQA